MGFDKQEGIMVAYYRTINKKINKHSNNYWDLRKTGKGESRGKYIDNPSYTMKEIKMRDGISIIKFYRDSKLFHSTSIERLAELDKQFDRDLNKVFCSRIY